MDIPVAVLIVLGAASLAGGAMAFAHHKVQGPLLIDSGRGRSMVQVTGTMFAVVLAFVILAAFQTYNGSRSGAQSEAGAVLDMSRTAALFPPAQRDELRTDFICYGRAVVNREWPAMRSGHSSPAVEYWVAAYRAEFDRLDLRSPREQLALQELLSEAATRTSGRLQRLSNDTPSVPTPLWLALLFGGCIAVSLQLVMVDPREKLRVQAPLVAGLASVVAAGLLVVFFLDHPYQHQIGGIQPRAMQQTLVTMQNLDPGLRVACSQIGLPV